MTHIIGKVYDMNQANWNKLIAELECEKANYKGCLDAYGSLKRKCDRYEAALKAVIEVESEWGDYAGTTRSGEIAKAALNYNSEASDK